MTQTSLRVSLFIHFWKFLIILYLKKKKKTSDKFTIFSKINVQTNVTLVVMRDWVTFVSGRQKSAGQPQNRGAELM